MLLEKENKIKKHILQDYAKDLKSGLPRVIQIYLGTWVKKWVKKDIID